MEHNLKKKLSTRGLEPAFLVSVNIHATHSTIIVQQDVADGKRFFQLYSMTNNAIQMIASLTLRLLLQLFLRIDDSLG